MQAKHFIIATLISLTAFAAMVFAWLGPITIKNTTSPNLTDTTNQTSTPSTPATKLAVQSDFTPLFNRRFQTWQKIESTSSAPSIRVEDSLANAHGIVYQGSIIEKGHSFGFFKTDSGQVFKTLGHPLPTDGGTAIIIDIQPDHAIIQFNNQPLKLIRETPPPSTFAPTTSPSNNQTPKDPAAGRAVLGRSPKPINPNPDTP